MSLELIIFNGILFSEGFCALLGILNYKKLKQTYWKCFVWYCVIIFLSEMFSKFILDYYPNKRKFYFDFFGIPIQFFFLFWLYAKKSLQSNRLYLISTITYLCFLVPHFFYISETRLINQMSYTMGCFLLLIMCVLEFNKQIKSDDILNFKFNKMFYINIGVIIFYIGTMPFFTFDKYLFENQKVIWSNYKLFFLISVNIMYLLFAASFVWGKPKP